MTNTQRARTILWATTLCAAFALTGCGGGGGGGGSSQAASSSSSTAQPISQVAPGAPDAGRSASDRSQSAAGNEIGNGAATVQWVAPQEKTDGSVLQNLGGFTIMYGTSPENLNRTVRIDNPSIDSYVVEQLPAGTYYFAVKAHDSNGIESEPSNLLTKVIS